MASTVYVFGAGINRVITDTDGLSPPLATDFFQMALKHPSIGSEDYQEKIRCVFDFVDRYWKLRPAELASQPFDLETCFTLLQMQLHEAQQAGDQVRVQELLEVYWRLTLTLIEMLQHFEHHGPRNSDFVALGKLIFSQKAAVLTFNYDTLIESVIEEGSGKSSRTPPTLLHSGAITSDVTEEELSWSPTNWRRSLAYAVTFDEVRLDIPGISKRVSGACFFGHTNNQPYNVPVLKLHGSLNWFRYSSLPLHPDLTPVLPASNLKAGQTVLANPSVHFNDPPFRDLRILEPLIVTPTLYKDYWQYPLSAVWQRARDELKDCRVVVVGGYSFPPADFAARKLFLEAFSDHTPDQLIVINPDTSVVQLAKSLCHFEKPVLVCKDLKEFLAYHAGGQD